MEPEVTDNDIFDEQASEAGLGDYVSDAPVQSDTIVEASPEEEDNDYDFDNDPLNLFQDVDSLTDDDIDEVSNFSPEDGVRLQSLKVGSDALGTYIRHQQGNGGFNQIMSGNISSEVMSNMRNNLPSNLRKVPAEQLRDVFLGYWRNKLGNVKLSGSQEEIQAITTAAKEMGEDPSKWLRIAQVESNFNAGAVSPSGRHKGYFQVNSSYVSNPGLLRDPYYATKIAIRHGKNQFKGGKLDYQLGGLTPYTNATINTQPLSAQGYTPTGGIPYSMNNSFFKDAEFKNGMPQSTGFNPSNALSSMDPTGASQVISAIDKGGAALFNGINTGIQAYKTVKDLTGKVADAGITGITSILEEKKSQKDYLSLIKRLYGEGNYSDSPLDTLLKPKQAFAQDGY